MREMVELPPTVGKMVIAAIMVKGNLNITEKRVPQDGRFSITTDSHTVDIRLNASPGSYGTNLSLRFLDSVSITLTLSQLGLFRSNLENFNEGIHRPHGLILVTGPTGSGKSTSLYVALREINNGSRNIITIEDPIEYRLKGLKQMQVNNVQNFTFANGLRSIMRQGSGRHHGRRGS